MLGARKRRKKNSDNSFRLLALQNPINPKARVNTGQIEARDHIYVYIPYIHIYVDIYVYME